MNDIKCNAWTLALISAGLVSLASVAKAEEKPSSVLTALSATTLSGYVDTSAQWNIDTGNANTPNYAFSQGKADGFNLNVVKLTLEKPVDPAEAWSAGYKVDLLFGPDANLLPTQSTGIGADFGVKQAYVVLHAPVGNGLDMKLGVFDTIIGYEVFESINNPNFTRSYGYTMEPTTHTGFHVAYTFTDFFSAAVCVADTFGSKINERAFPQKAESYKTYMGMLTFTAPKELGFLAGSTLSASIINGFNSASAPTGGAADQTSFYVGATLNTPVSGLKVGACYDYAGVSKQPLTDNEASWTDAAGVYVYFQATEKLSLYGRGEYAWAETSTPFLARKVFETTFTVQYDLWKNVLSRLEFRWDHAADGSTPYGGVQDGDPGTRSNSYILLANLAYKF